MVALLGRVWVCSCLVILLGAAPAPARRVEIRILHTTDLHGHVLPTRDYEGRTNVGGLLRCATLIEQLRGEREHTLLVDCGDLYQGSAEGLLSEGRIMVRALGWLRYDAWVLGNHEFDWGHDKLAAAVGDATVPVLAANLDGLPRLNRAGRPTLRAFVLREFDGVRAAVVGLTTPGIPSWSLPEILGETRVESSIAALHRIMPEVRAARPDVYILAAHQGWRSFGDDYANEIAEVARKFPEFDLILGGHTHQPVAQAEVGGALYSQAGYHGVWLGCVDLAYDTEARRLVARQARLLDVAAEVPEHEPLASYLQEDLVRARAYMAERIGEAAENLPHALDVRGHSPLQMLLARALAERVECDVVLHGLLAEESLAAGPLLMEDVWRVVPYENRVGLITVTGDQLAEILSENDTRRGTIHYMGALGVTVSGRPGRRGPFTVADLVLPDGRPVGPEQKLRVALNSYVLASGGQRFPRLAELVRAEQVDCTLTREDTRGAVVRYIREHSPLRVEELMESAPRTPAGVRE